MHAGATLIPTEPIPPAQPSARRRIFIGKDGMRAGWSLLIFIAIFAALAFCANFIVHKLLPSAPTTAQGAADAMAAPGFLLTGESIQFLLILVVTWIMSKIERSPNSVYGFGGSPKPPNFLARLGLAGPCFSLP